MEQVAEGAVEEVAEGCCGPSLHRLLDLGDLYDAWVLAELDDDRSRFPDARAVKAFARSAPIAQVSGGPRSSPCRRIVNRRLAAVGFA
jgi:hypothetical protein